MLLPLLVVEVVVTAATGTAVDLLDTTTDLPDETMTIDDPLTMTEEAAVVVVVDTVDPHREETTTTGTETTLLVNPTMTAATTGDEETTRPLLADEALLPLPETTTGRCPP